MPEQREITVTLAPFELRFNEYAVATIQNGEIKISTHWLKQAGFRGILTVFEGYYGENPTRFRVADDD